MPRGSRETMRDENDSKALNSANTGNRGQDNRAPSVTRNGPRAYWTSWRLWRTCQLVSREMPETSIRTPGGRRERALLEACEWSSPLVDLCETYLNSLRSSNCSLRGRPSLANWTTRLRNSGVSKVTMIGGYSNSPGAHEAFAIEVLNSIFSVLHLGLRTVATPKSIEYPTLEFSNSMKPKPVACLVPLRNKSKSRDRAHQSSHGSRQRALRAQRISKPHPSEYQWEALINEFSTGIT